MRALLLPLVLAACQPMYGAPPQVLRDPARRPVPIGATDPTPPPTPYVESCTVNFHDGAKVARRDPDVARTRVAAGNAKLAAAATTTEPPKKATLLVDGIQQYRAALVVDPFDADATLQLARAYDKVYRKGCALKLLDRLALLAQHPKLGAKAKLLAQDVQDNDDWFKDYRSAAKDAALGVRNP
jgi:hypothetical protein